MHACMHACMHVAAQKRQRQGSRPALRAGFFFRCIHNAMNGLEDRFASAKGTGRAQL